MTIRFWNLPKSSNRLNDIFMDTSSLKADPLSRRTIDYLAQAKDFFVNLWDRIYGFFASYHWKEILLNIKLISLIISLIFAGLIFFLLVKINARGRLQRAVAQDKSAPQISDKKIVKKWRKIEKKLVSNLEANYKLAILEADGLFESILGLLGYGAEAKITNLEEIKELKKIKNNIVENSGFKITREEAEKVIGTYKKGLKDLGII